jgi:hypothetical protein
MIERRPSRKAASKPLDVCLEQDQLFAVILIIGFMAGSLIPESPELIYTRAEFDLAQRLGRPAFAFFKTEGGVPVNKGNACGQKEGARRFHQCLIYEGSPSRHLPFQCGYLGPDARELPVASAT